MRKEIYDLKLLYVEDEEDTLQPLVRFLKRRFSLVISAKDGKEGWDQFKEIHPDIIITDLLMPDYSGIEMIEKIRKTGYSNPIIITSALQDVNSIIKTIDIGVNKYILKPINLDQFDQDLITLANDITLQRKKLFNMTYAQKKVCESDIKCYLSKILKKHTGKGPKDVKVIILNDQIEITCIDVLTRLEITLLQNGKNVALVEQNRRLLYQLLKKEIEDMLFKEIQCNIIITEININPVLNTDVIRLNRN